MILLDGHTLKQKRKIRLESMQLTIKERESTATITTNDTDGIEINSWMMDDTDPGEGIVWRVKSISQSYLTDTTTIQLEHVINTLRDQILFGEFTTATLADKKKASTVTAKKAVQTILKQQSIWTLGTFSFSDSNPYKFDGDSLFDAIEKISDSLQDAFWTYDFSEMPFKLNIKEKATVVRSVMRVNRNIRTITKSIDKSGMYTRFYPIGKGDLHITGDYVQKNTKAYGVISKVETDQSISTEAELIRWANERLAKHAEPTVTIKIEGLELADATGEALDELKIGRLCMVPLAEFGTTITETITCLTYNDKVNRPAEVQVTLANERQDITKIIADSIKSAGGGGRTAAKQEKEDMAWFEDTNEHVAMCAKGIIGVDEKGNPNWTRMSEVVVDGEGIHQRVTSTMNDVANAWTAIEQNEEAISLEAERALEAEGSLSGQIKVAADKVSLVVKKKKGKYVIDTAEIVTGINNQTGSYVKISAKTINLEGYVKAKDLSAVTASINNLKTGQTTAEWLRATKMGCSNFTINTGGTFYMRGYAATWKLLQYKDHSGANKEMYVLGR